MMPTKPQNQTKIAHISLKLHTFVHTYVQIKYIHTYSVCPIT